MSCPRVNLLKKSEQRYQGAVSLRFMYVAIVVTPILFIAIISGVKLVQYSSVQADLKVSRAIWQEVEPQLKLFKEERHSLETNRQALELLGGWTNSQISFVRLLTDMQDTVPQNIQFTRLSIRSKDAVSVHASAEELELRYKLLIEGLSQGRLAEDEVIQLRKDLLGSQAIAATFDAINLASMRKRVGAQGINMREFKLEGTAPKGDGK